MAQTTLAQGMEAAMAAEALKVLEDLFAAESAYLWTVSFPTSQTLGASGALKAPSAHTFDAIPLQGKEGEATRWMEIVVGPTLTSLREAAQGLFTRPSPSSPAQITATLHNKSY